MTTPATREDGTPMPVFTPIGHESGVTYKVLHEHDTVTGKDRFHGAISFNPNRGVIVPSPWFDPADAASKEAAIQKFHELVAMMLRDEFFGIETPSQPPQ